MIPGYFLARLGASLKSSFLAVFGAAAVVVPALPTIIFIGFKWINREWEADFIGMLLMSDSGYDATAAHSFLESALRTTNERDAHIRREHGISQYLTTPARISDYHDSHMLLSGAHSWKLTNASCSRIAFDT